MGSYQCSRTMSCISIYLLLCSNLWDFILGTSTLYVTSQPGFHQPTPTNQSPFKLAKNSLHIYTSSYTPLYLNLIKLFLIFSSCFLIRSLNSFIHACNYSSLPIPSKFQCTPEIRWIYNIQMIQASFHKFVLKY